MNKEEWKSIPNYEEFYDVSSLGRVKNKLNNTILKQSTDNCGYLVLNLKKDCIRKTKRVHQLVAMAFLNHKTCGMKLVVDHINGKKDDNRLDNLQIITQKQNIQKRQNQIFDNIIIFENKIIEYLYKKSLNYQPIIYIKTNNKWITRILKKDKFSTIGAFDNKTEAMLTFINKMKIKL